MTRSDNKKHLGEVLVELGRISEAEIERALEHQRLQGGYFGQALVDLGIIEPEELEVGLASQANIPYMNPRAGQIDPEVAALMPAIWAQRHNALPILREEGWLTLLVDSPLKFGLADELARRTGLSVRLALCSARALRELIREVYQLDPVQQKASQVLSLEAFWSLATSPPALRWGLTVRRNQIIGWIRRGDKIQRHALMHNWLSFFDRLLSPPPSQLLPPHGLRRWRAGLRSDQSPPAVLIQSLSGPGGHDLIFEPVSDTIRARSRLPSSEQIATLRRSLAREAVVLAVHSPSGQAARELVTRLPSLLLKADHRSICLLREGIHAVSDDMLVASPPDDGDDEMLTFLEALDLDAVGLEIDPGNSGRWRRALGLAPLVMVVLSGMQPGELMPPGVNWLLSKSREDQSEWDLI
ncbi:MAG: hypothetical protein EA370_15065 [Wenzhouxiangella sp.]|nr:MAG: hypothetical protein EA370_15065 [Wenzhouxiangella sp.]